jgi:ABC-type amino acid transport system permease subunit
MEQILQNASRGLDSALTAAQELTLQAASVLKTCQYEILMALSAMMVAFAVYELIRSFPGVMRQSKGQKWEWTRRAMVVALMLTPVLYHAALLYFGATHVPISA